MKPDKIAISVVPAIIILLAVISPISAAGADAQPEDAGYVDPADSTEVDDSLAELGLSEPDDDGLNLIEQDVDDATIDRIKELRNQPEDPNSGRTSGDKNAPGLANDGFLTTASCVNGCEGKDPVAEGCDDGAVIREYVDTIGDAKYLVQLRFSNECMALWSRAIHIEGSPGHLMTLETKQYIDPAANGRDDTARTSTSVTVSGYSDGWTWTSMLVAPGFPNVRACSRPQSDGLENFLQCSKPGYTSLISSPGYCLDVPYRNFVNGQRVWIYDCLGAANVAQMWQVRPDGTIRIGSYDGTMKCLRVDGGRAGDAIPVVIWDCLGYSSQQWRYETTGQIINTANGRRCLDVPNGVAKAATYVQVWTCMVYTSNGEPIAAQRWSSPSAAHL